MGASSSCSATPPTGFRSQAGSPTSPTSPEPSACSAASPATPWRYSDGRRESVASSHETAEFYRLRVVLFELGLLGGGELGLHRRDLGVDLISGSVAHCQLTIDVVLTRAELCGVVGQGAGVDQLVQRAGARLHLGDAVLGPLYGGADIVHLTGESGERFADLHLRSRGSVLSLDRLFLGAE